LYVSFTVKLVSFDTPAYLRGRDHPQQPKLQKACYDSKSDTTTFSQRAANASKPAGGGPRGEESDTCGMNDTQVAKGEAIEEASILLEDFHIIAVENLEDETRHSAHQEPSMTVGPTLRPDFHLPTPGLSLQSLGLKIRPVQGQEPSVLPSLTMRVVPNPLCFPTWTSPTR